MRRSQIEVALSHLVPGRRNPRRVKPGREAHHRLVALIRSQGLTQPLVVRPIADKPRHYEVIAGNRRLAALREVHRGDAGNPKVPCLLRDVDADTADALALGENFGQERMHPLDEADAFAKLAEHDGKDAKIIAAEFGVPEQYVRQRMKLAALAAPLKAAYRDGAINTAMAEAFASVPEDRQTEVWEELGGHPRHADHVRNVIANAWIDAGHALFDVAALPPSAVSRDLFGDRVLVERQAFMAAQSEALNVQRQSMAEDGWAEVVVGRRDDVQDRLYAMATPERTFDEATRRTLAKLTARREKLERAAETCDGDEARLARIYQRYDALEAQVNEIMKQSPEFFSEETKAVATSFLILDADGRVHREYRVPRQRPRASANGNGTGESQGGGARPKVPTSDDLSDNQLAVTFTHQALAVREALLNDARALKRVLALILHDKIRSEALSVRHDPNGTTLHAASGDGFKSAAFDRLRAARAKLDPFVKKHHVDDRKAYATLCTLPGKKLDAFIELLVVECLTAHPRRTTELVACLAEQLKVNVRDVWRPDAEWLSGFRKIQLSQLTTELKGAVHTPSPERKKSELVESLAKLFTDAAEGRIEDAKLAATVNAWLPVNLRARR